MRARLRLSSRGEDLVDVNIIEHILPERCTISGQVA